jgi:coniferyl-aldehyde dehydrogenase
VRSRDSLEARTTQLRAAFHRDPYPAFERRETWLLALRRLLDDLREPLCEAVTTDFGHRAREETLLGDFWVTRRQLAYTLSNLDTWMQPQAAEVPLTLLPGRAFTLAQPRGVVGVLAPWNYPVMLALTPLIGALAAGNRVLLKLSEHTPKTSELLANALSERLGEDVVAPILGDADVGRMIPGLDLDLILFTGATDVGREVARAAAERLTPVILELGGKCPAILGPGYPVSTFAKRVVQGKCFNAGQSCVAPDYVLVERGREQAVIDAIANEVRARFPTLRDNPDYTSVAGVRRFGRLQSLRDEALAAGAQAIVINPGNETLEGTTKLPLTLLTGTPDSCRVMQEEIFGPLLPVVGYTGLEEALAYVSARPRPLALYYFDDRADRVKEVIERSMSGGVTVNDTLLHFITDSLPRGGVGRSGMGCYQGHAGFLAFSHVKPVFQQARINAARILSPPYAGFTARVVDWLLRR